MSSFRRCDKLVIFSTESDWELGAVALPNITSSRKDLWNKTRKVNSYFVILSSIRQAFAYVWQHHRDEADWFVKADDDTYMVVDNLRCTTSLSYGTFLRLWSIFID